LKDIAGTHPFQQDIRMKALKLDSSYRPIEIIDAIEALVMCLMGKAQAVESYDREIRSPSKSFKIPAVVVLKRYIKKNSLSVTPNRLNVVWRDQNQCQYCAKKFKTCDLTIDHILPKSRGGTKSWTNLTTACKKCNQAKGNKTPSECGMYPLRKPSQPQSTIMFYLKRGAINDLWQDYLWEKVMAE